MRRTAVVPLLLLAVAHLASGAPAEQSVIVSRIKREPVQSSALAAIGYSKHLRALEIEFLNGAIYRYCDVPPAIYHSLMNAPSKAQFYDENIRRHFRSRHVKPASR